VTKRIGAIVAIVVLAGLVIGVATRAMAGGSGTTTGKPSRTITVTSTAVVHTKPNEAVVDLGVESQSTDSAAAFAQNAKDMQAVLAALETAGVSKADIRTVNLSLSRRESGRGSGRHLVFVASNQVQVTVHDIQAVGSVIDAAVRAGADSVQDVRFQVSDSNAVRTEALTAAVKSARTKADALAAEAGATVVRVVTINEEGFRSPVYRAPYAAGASLAVPAPTPVLTPTSLQASETVQVIWEIA
jgi:uncharacterized protein